MCIPKLFITNGEISHAIIAKTAHRLLILVIGFVNLSPARIVSGRCPVLLISGTDRPWAASILTLAIDPVTPTTLYAGATGPYASGGGVFKSIDGGNHLDPEHQWHGTGR